MHSIIWYYSVKNTMLDKRNYITTHANKENPVNLLMSWSVTDIPDARF